MYSLHGSAATLIYDMTSQRIFLCSLTPTLPCVSVDEKVSTIGFQHYWKHKNAQWTPQVVYWLATDDIPSESSHVWMSYRGADADNYDHVGIVSRRHRHTSDTYCNAFLTMSLHIPTPIIIMHSAFQMTCSTLIKYTHELCTPQHINLHCSSHTHHIIALHLKNYVTVARLSLPESHISCLQKNTVFIFMGKVYLTLSLSDLTLFIMTLSLRECV